MCHLLTGTNTGLYSQEGRVDELSPSTATAEGTTILGQGMCRRPAGSSLICEKWAIAYGSTLTTLGYHGLSLHG